MTPKNSKPKPPPAPVESCWREDDIDKYWNWDFYVAAEDRSLDRMIEALRRRDAATRAVLGIKLRLADIGMYLRLTPAEHMLISSDFEGWAKTETDPKKAAELSSMAKLAEALGKSAAKKLEAAAKKTKRPRKRRRDPKPR